MITTLNKTITLIFWGPRTDEPATGLVRLAGVPSPSRPRSLHSLISLRSVFFGLN